MPKRKSEYGADQIKSLSDVDHVRLRPDMYIGSTDSDGLHHVFIEALDNAIDENVEGHTDEIHINLDTDEGFIEVWDYGRGIPVAKHKETGRPTLLMVVDTLKTGGKFAEGVYQTSAGLHGVGVKATNFLAEWFEVEVSRNGKVYYARYEKGVKVGGDKIKRLGLSAESWWGDRSGTRIRFAPDPEIFSTTKFDPGRVRQLAEEASYTCDARFSVTVDGQTVEYYNPDGLMGRLHKLIVDQDDEIVMQHEPIYFEEDVVDGDRTARVEVALVWTNGFDEVTRSYVNTKFVREGGTHETGLRRAITARMNQEKDIGKDLSTDDFRAGLYAVIHYKCHGPKFKGQTKDKLQTTEAVKDVSRTASPHLNDLFDREEELLKYIIERAVSLRDARKKFKSIKATLTKMENASKRRMPLPDKAALCPDCKPGDRELFLVEGDSAGGSAKKARDTDYQEVLPLRGKVINAEKGQAAHVLANKEIQSMTVMLGCGLDQVTTGDGCDPENARVGRVLLLMDADSDGLHIATLVLTFMINYMLPMIRAGKVYIVDSPLFMGTKGQSRIYGRTKEDVLERLPGASITRFKGHGEADFGDLKAYAMDPSSRALIKVDQAMLGRAKSLMGADSEPRKVLLGLRETPKDIPGYLRVNGEYRKINEMAEDVRLALLDALRPTAEA